MTTKRLLLYFPKSETDMPIVYHLVKDHDLMVNIFRAKVTPDEFGYLVLDVTGTDENIERAMRYVRTFDVRVDEANKGVQWEREVCTECGNCVPHCPTKALHVADARTRSITFSGELCIECLACIANCPYGACSSIF